MATTRGNRTQRLKKGRQEQVLEGLRNGGTIAAVCREIGVDRSAYYRWRHQDPDFPETADDALTTGTEMLEAELARRGFRGYDEPVFYQGRQCYRRDPKTDELVLDKNGDPIPLAIRKFSDTAAIFILKARNPHRYRDHPPATATGDTQPIIEIISWADVKSEGREGKGAK
jgi:Transposase